MAAIRQMEVMHQDGSDALRVPAYVDAKALGAGVAEAFAVPTGARYALFSSTTNFYAKYDGAATVPGDTADGSAAELNPATRYLGDQVSEISVIAPSAGVVTVMFYK